MERLDNGAKTILAQFPLRYRGKPLVLWLDPTAQEIFTALEELNEEVTLCSVDYWTTPGTYGGMDCTPHGVRELYRITPLED